MIKQKSQNLLLILAFLCFLTILPFASFFICRALNPESKKQDVPSINITLVGTDLETISNNNKETVYSGNILETSDGGVFSDVKIRGRGNSSWLQPKKPFNVTIPKSQSLLGLAPAEKWILIPNHLDHTMLRNDIAFHIAEMLEMPYARQGKFFELSINGEYQGLYYLTHKITADKSDVGLKEPTGIIAEIDMLWTPKDECVFSDDGACIVVKDVNSNDDLADAILDLQKTFSELERATKKHDYERIKEIVDIDFAIKYYLLSEFTLDPDAYTTSFYMYKDGPKDKIHFGPGWDFDYALGNRDWGYANNLPTFHNPTNLMPRKDETMTGAATRIFYRLTDIPEFIDDVKAVFKQLLSGKWDELLKYVDDTKSFIYDAVRRNDEKWEKSNFDAEYDYLIDWISTRYDFFEGLYGK